MAAFAEGKTEERPSALDAYFLSRDWSAYGDVMSMDAREFTQMRIARNIYETVKSYESASDKVAWTRANVDGWELVGAIFALQEEEGQLA